jgi:hypothetical protein
MKIGLSYSRCVRDIVDGVVDIDDVLVLITRTDFDPRDADQWQGIWVGYGGGTENAYSQGFFSHVIQNGQATLMKIDSVVSALNFGSLVSYISHASLAHILVGARKFG